MIGDTAGIEPLMKQPHLFDRTVLKGKVMVDLVLLSRLCLDDVHDFNESYNGSRIENSRETIE
jgi:hypothetical protein